VRSRAVESARLNLYPVTAPVTGRVACARSMRHMIHATITNGLSDSE